MVKKIMYLFSLLSDEYTDRKFLMSTPFPVALILALYLWFVLRTGPELMKYKKPFQLNKTIAVYNILQVLLSCYIFQTVSFK